ncbi:MAG: hypothetical protein WCE62_06940 [Polyangiales bacterium]
MIVQLKGWVGLALVAMLSAGCISCSTSPAPKEEDPGTVKSSAAASTWESGPQEPLSQVDIDAITAAVNEGAAAYRDGQLSKFSNKFSADGKLMPPNSSPRVGKPAIGMFAKQSPKIDTLSVTDIQMSGAGNNATVSASVVMTGKTNNPANDNAVDLPVSSTGSLLISMKKENGAWLAKHVAYVPQ